MIMRSSSWTLALALAGCTPAPLVTAPADAPRTETDAPALVVVTAHTPAGPRALGVHRAALALPDGRALLVTEDRALILDEAGARRTLLDGVSEAPVLLDEAHVLVSRATSPGQSDLWRVPLARGEKPRAIAARAGADGQPFVLDDGRVLFVSDRSGVASVFVVTPHTDAHAVTQLTNVGERPGALSASFVPPPVRWLAQEGARVRYDAGDRTVLLDLHTGRAEVL